MPFLVFLLLIVLVAMFGFWDTLQAIVGATLLIVILAVVFALTVVALVRALMRPRRRRIFDKRDDRWR